MTMLHVASRRLRTKMMLSASAAALILESGGENGRATRMEELANKHNSNLTSSTPSKTTAVGASGLFYGECPKHLMYTPKLPYPAWDHNWDTTNAADSSSSSSRSSSTQPLPPSLSLDREERPTPPVLVVRHIFLIRHGQYEQQGNVDRQRILTQLGRRQAERTGKRLAAQMMSAATTTNSNHVNDNHCCCRLKAIHVSDMARAKETAAIIAAELNRCNNRNGRSGGANSPAAVVVQDPDPTLNEALPAPIVPRRNDVGSLEDQEMEILENRDRIEEAFQKYFYRSIDVPQQDKAIVDNNGDDDTICQHEFEVLVCHANVIRYFLMRALQLPPEAWLRFSLFNCSITHLMVQPNGYVTARLVGDTGHIRTRKPHFPDPTGTIGRHP